MFWKQLVRIIPNHLLKLAGGVASTLTFSQLEYYIINNAFLSYTEFHTEEALSLEQAQVYTLFIRFFALGLSSQWALIQICWLLPTILKL